MIEMEDCECVGAELVGQSPPFRIVLKTVPNSVAGHLDLTANRDCPHCDGTGQTPVGLELRKAAALFRENGFTVVAPEEAR